MRQSKFTETQIVSILKEADAGRPVNESWQTYGISSATYYKWNAKYGGLEASDVKRLKVARFQGSTTDTHPEMRMVGKLKGEQA